MPSGADVVDHNKFISNNMDNNDKVELGDARVVLKAALKIIELTDEQIQIGDMNSDKQITLADTQSVLRTALKIE